MSAKPAAVPDAAYAELVAAAPEQRLLAVLRCTRSERVAPGSRSERAVLHTVVVIAPPGSVATGSAVVLTRYAQGKDPLLPGTMYLVAAVREEYAPAYTLVSASVVGQETAAPVALAAAFQELSRRDPGVSHPRPIPPITQAAPVIHATAAVEQGALVVRYTIDNAGPEAVVVADRTYSQAIHAFEDNFAQLDWDAAAHKLTVRRDGFPATQAQNSWLQRVTSGRRATGRIAIPLTALSREDVPRKDTPWTIRRINLQLGWAPVSVAEAELREPPARVQHDGCELEAPGARGITALKQLTIEIAAVPPVTLR